MRRATLELGVKGSTRIGGELHVHALPDPLGEPADRGKHGHRRLRLRHQRRVRAIARLRGGVHAAPDDATKLELGYSYTDAILTAGFTAGVVPDLVGQAGDRLPNVSKQQVTLALDHSQPLTGDTEFHARLMPRIAAISVRALPNSAFATDLPGFTLLNARPASRSARPGGSMPSSITSPTGRRRRPCPRCPGTSTIAPISPRDPGPSDRSSTIRSRIIK